MRTLQDLIAPQEFILTESTSTCMRTLQSLTYCISNSSKLLQSASKAFCAQGRTGLWPVPRSYNSFTERAVALQKTTLVHVFFDVKCIVFTTAEFSRKHSRTLRGPCDTILDRNCVMQVVFRFYKVHETSCRLKVVCGLRQGQEEANSW